jgi:demethylmenaquinone methyltransferase / 2-methoxy-6-polyprenyl-1,4-benzoquinol methylase
VLKPQGRLYVLEFFKSDRSLMAAAFDFYFKNVLPRIGGLFSDRSAYEYLPRSVSSMPSGPEFKTMLESSGFRVVEEVKWLFGATRLFVAEKP